MPFLKVSPGLEMFYAVDDHTDPWDASDVVLMIHGFTESTPAWNAWVPYFSRRFRVLRCDLRGFGQSGPVASDFTFTSELLANDFAQLIEAVAGKSVHIVSAKSGGLPAIKLAALHPHLVKSLTLVGVPVFAPKSEGWIDHMERHGVRSWAHATNRQRFGAGMPQAGIDWWADLMGRTALSTAHAWLRWAAAADPVPDLPAVKCPGLVMTGTAPMGTHEETAIFQRGMPQAETVVVPTDGYHAAGAAPDSCAQATARFIERHSHK